MKKISAICPTFNRISKRKHLLEEAIESFLRQDYPNKELILVNDAPGQVLVCDKPGVRIFNLSERFKTLGEKYNWAINACDGELICSFEDDDISLPHRLSFSAEQIEDYDYYNPKFSFFLDGAGLHVTPSTGL
jgi:glycosyltransferase involved in cell wall biosynthesis